MIPQIFDKMVGLILCGGESSRMGDDKGLLNIDDTTWAGRSMKMMEDLVSRSFLSVNKNQLPGYLQIFTEDILICDNTDLGINGPLCAILSAHILYPDEDIFVLACDLPLMTKHLVQKLSEHHSSGSQQAYVYSNDGNAEPLCGIYKSSALASIISHHQTKRLEKFSMKYVLGLLDCYKLPLREDEKIYFMNINTPADLKAIQRNKNTK